MRRLRVVGLVLVAGLTACSPISAAPSNGGSQPDTTPEATLTPQPQERETGLTQPATVFEGQCESVFSDAELTAALGEPVFLGGNHFDAMWAGDFLFSQNGGFECTWTGDARVIALLLPEAAVDYDPTARACRLEEHDTGLMTCPLEAVANGIRLSGLVSLGLDQNATEAAGDALVTTFLAKAAQQVPIPVPIPALGSWRMPADCEAIAAGADFSAVPGLGAGTTGFQGGYGKDTTQAENAVAGEWSALNCGLQGADAVVGFIPAGGERWRESSIASRGDATPLTLSGVDAAYAVPYADGKSLIYAFSGPNMLLFEVRYTSNAAGIATALIAALDATAVN